MKNNLRDASAGSSHFPPPRSNRSVHSPLRYTGRHPPSELSLIEVLVPLCTSYIHTHAHVHRHTHLFPHNFPSFSSCCCALFSSLSVLNFIAWLLPSLPNISEVLFHLLGFRPTLRALNLENAVVLGPPMHISARAPVSRLRIAPRILRFSFFL